MDVLDLARLQFGATTVYHFMFVPLTIGLSPIVAILQTIWYRTGDEKWFRITRFFGKLLLINFAIGVATGIVQEFQFGMNWSEYSRFVGDVFGAPLAMEALAAFFLESTFLGLWIFGWDRLPRAIHLASVWAFSIGTWLSAYFIIAANSFMQHPVGARYNPETGRAELESIGAVLTNPTTLVAFPHVISGALLTGATFVTGIACWWMLKSARAKRENDAQAYRSATLVGLIVLVVAGVGVMITGDSQAKIMFKQQPMKMAAAEGLCVGEDGVPFSILAIGDLTNDCANVDHVIELPGVTSFLADGTFDAYLAGVEELQPQYEELYGPGQNYVPNLVVTYWSFRLMIGFAVFSGLLAVAALWYTRGKRTTGPRWLGILAVLAVPMPFLGNSFGWIFTEMGRQPWVVNPAPEGDPAIRLLTMDGVSPNPAWMVATTVIGFVVLYGVLAVFWVRLMLRYAREGLVAESEPVPVDSDDDTLHFAY
ncbi:MAG: cytochrome ubiquinol oxidase subunit I [Actinomycetales bacterium]